MVAMSIKARFTACFLLRRKLCDFGLCLKAVPYVLFGEAMASMMYLVGLKAMTKFTLFR